MSNVEVLCLSGLEHAIVGYQVTADKNAGLVYDYEKTVAELQDRGYDEEEIESFFENIQMLPFPGPLPIFVKVDSTLGGAVAETKPIIHDDRDPTYH